MLTQSHFSAGNYFVVLHEGDIIPAHEIRSTPLGLEVKTGSVATILDPLVIEAIYPVQDLAIAARPEETNLSAAEQATLLRTLSGVIEIERLARQFTKERGPLPLKLVLYGSASLSLTILPLRVSHDVDVASTSSGFVEFAQAKMRKSRGAVPEFSSSRILGYLGAWESRSASFEGLYGTEFLLLHPLDTMMQKLLRIDETRFGINDQKDICDIIRLLRPSEETLALLLTENPGRYRIPPNKDQARAVARNTAWFLREFLPALSYSDLTQRAEAREEQELRQSGLAPLPARSLRKSTHPPVTPENEPLP